MGRVLFFLLIFSLIIWCDTIWWYFWDVFFRYLLFFLWFWIGVHWCIVLLSELMRRVAFWIGWYSFCMLLNRLFVFRVIFLLIRLIFCLVFMPICLALHQCDRICIICWGLLGWVVSSREKELNMSRIVKRGCWFMSKYLRKTSFNLMRILSFVTFELSMLMQVFINTCPSLRVSSILIMI